jgi:glycogen debranching enzyme
MKIVLCVSILLLAFTDVQSISPQDGISNQGRNKTEPYVTAGDRMYLIGSQDGNFPDLGDHVPGEMGGLWLHPIKLADGFWAKVIDVDSNQEVVLSDASEFVNFPYGNRFVYSPIFNGIQVERFQFSSDGQQGFVVQYRFNNQSDSTKAFKFQFLVKTDLSPVWFSDRLGIKDAPDNVSWEPAQNLFVAKDTDNNWFAVWGAEQSANVQPIAYPSLPLHTKGKGVAAGSEHTISVAKNTIAELSFIFAGSTKDPDEAIGIYKDVAGSLSELLKKKKEHYASIIETARIKIPDQRLQEVYDWVKVNTEWLVRDVPGIGRGVSGGFMEYPWWFGTESYTLQALAATGNFDLAKETLRLLKHHSFKANGNGRVVHEITTNGGISNPGNTQETSQFIITVGTVFDWSGDVEFIREMYPFVKMSIEWLLADMDQNKNLFPEGYGIMEVYGLNAELIDVSVYTQAALETASHIATILNDPIPAKRYRELASQLKDTINEKFWVEEYGSYSDFYGNTSQALSAVDGAIKQIKLKGEDKLTVRDRKLIEDYQRLKQQFAAMPNTNRGWITNKNWVITTPMETGIAPKEKAIRLLNKIRKENVGEYGPYLSAVEKQAMMTISTGVQAISEANYGRIDEAMWYVDKIVQTFNRKLPGSISEMMPDYGCFTVAWTSYGIIIPLIRHVFGIQPDAFHKTVLIEPHLPAGWEDIRISSLPIGLNVISFSRARTDKGIEYNLTSNEDGWNFTLKAEALAKAKYFLNGVPVSFDPSGIQLKGKQNQVLIVDR